MTLCIIQGFGWTMPQVISIPTIKNCPQLATVTNMSRTPGTDWDEEAGDWWYAGKLHPRICATEEKSSFTWLRIPESAISTESDYPSPQLQGGHQSPGNLSITPRDAGDTHGQA